MVIFCGFISLLIGRETINIPEIFSGVHGFTGKTVISSNLFTYFEAQFMVSDINEILSFSRKFSYQNVDYVKLTNIKI